MDVTARGVLRFKNRPALEEGLVAFDERAFVQFFRSELWTIAGAFAVCEVTFELPVDCDPSPAFSAMAKLAVEGAIDLRESDRPGTFVRIENLRKPKPVWATSRYDETESQRHGERVDRYLGEWGARIEEAKTADVTRAAKAVKKSTTRKTASGAHRDTVIALDDDPSDVAVLPDGSIAVAAGSQIVFVAPTGERLGTTACELKQYDPFQNGITGLTVLADGRVVAHCEHSAEARIAKRGDERAMPVVIPGERTGSVKGVRASGDRMYLISSTWVVVVDLATCEVIHEIVPWSQNYIFEAALHGDGLIVSNMSECLAFDAAGEYRFGFDGKDVVITSHGILAQDDHAAILVSDTGNEVRRFDTGEIAAKVSLSRGWLGPRAVFGDAMFIATRWPKATARWSLSSGECLWKTNTHTGFPGGCIATSQYVASWAPPHYDNSDTAIAVVEPTTGALLTRLDAGALILDAVALGDDAIVAYCEGRTAGSKVRVWRSITTSPRAEILSGHKGRIGGLRVLPDGRLLSWAADKSARIWGR